MSIWGGSVCINRGLDIPASAGQTLSYKSIQSTTSPASVWISPMDEQLDLSLDVIYHSVRLIPCELQEGPYLCKVTQLKDILRQYVAVNLSAATTLKT